MKTYKRFFKVWPYFLIGIIGVVVGYLVGGYLGAAITVFLGHLPILIGIVEAILTYIRWAQNKDSLAVNTGVVKNKKQKESKNYVQKTKKQPKNSRKNIFYICISGIVLIGIIILWLVFYINWQGRSVYHSDETIYFSDFSVKMTDYTVMDTTSMLNQDLIDNGGNLRSTEDCDSKYPQQSYYSSFWQSTSYVPNYENSECKELNDKLSIYSKYEATHKMIAMNIQITTNKNTNVKVSDIKTYMNVPSGRDVTKEVPLGNSDNYDVHVPYGVSEKLGYLNSDLSRTINLWTDLLNEEDLIDVVIMYHDEQKIFRLDI